MLPAGIGAEEIPDQGTVNLQLRCDFQNPFHNWGFNNPTNQVDFKNPQLSALDVGITCPLTWPHVASCFHCDRVFGPYAVPLVQGERPFYRQVAAAQF